MPRVLNWFFAADADADADAGVAVLLLLLLLVVRFLEAAPLPIASFAAWRPYELRVLLLLLMLLTHYENFALLYTALCVS
ncbi:unnamed protein product [Toxocara canis]|uniref:Secreted peptide n=1 Tax=Toxocara canis TaxID=6265 RepID=A0A183U4J7_TOXCA|nr:unnamed protein product [Toxocara canis]